MARVTLIQVIYNHKRFIEPVFSAMLAQTYKDFDVVAVISGNNDGSKEFLLQRFSEAQECALDELVDFPAKIKVWDPGYNIGFAKGHNEVFARMNSEFFQLVNPDLIIEPDYVSKLIKVFENPKVGAVTGKLLHADFVGADSIRPYDIQKTNLIDSTGVTITKSGRGRDRGQHEIDRGQYDDQKLVDAVSAAGAMYRTAALEAVKNPKVISLSLDANHSTLDARYEFFDEDFHSYWEDVDLAWRMRNAGWLCVYEPAAVAYHGRGAGSSEGGYKKVWSYIRFHKTINPEIRKLNYRNHILMYIKNSKWFYPQFFVREFFMLGYIVLFETSTLHIIPNLIKLLPKMWRKRKIIQK